MIGGYVYVFGGGDERVERAAIEEGGRLGPFVDTGARTLEGERTRPRR